METRGVILENLKLLGKDALPVIAGLMLIALLILLLSSTVLSKGQGDGEDFVNKLREKEKKLKEKEEKLKKIENQLRGMR